MSRSVKDSDDAFEPKPSIGRMQTRMLTVQSVNSPLRRSSRIKQNKYSPGSESDSSTQSSSTQTTWSARTRATMDSTASDTTKKLRTRKQSISSEISEIDIDTIPQTPVKRTTRQSLGATSLINTPTRVNTRATSKRVMRAGSETKSPLPATRTTRITRARSIDPESLTENKKQFSSPTKTRRRASVLPSSSQIKEQTEPNERIPYVRLDSTIVETDEITNSGNSDSSPDKQLQRLHKIKRNLQNVVKDKVEEDYSHETLTDSKSDETLQLSEEKDATQTEDITAKNTENILDKEQKKFEETPPSNKSTIEEFSTYSSPNHRNSAKEDTKIVENLSDKEKSLLDICGSNKEIEVMPENLSGSSLEEEKSDKENQMLNIISDVAEKLVQPKPASSIKSFTSSFMDELLSEKETKSMKKEVNLNKRLRSRESTEVAIKYSDLSKETIDNSQEKMDISLESINSSASDKIILLHESTKVIDKITSKDEISTENISAYNEDATEIISELEKTDTKECTITDNKNSNKSESNEVDKTSRLSINLIKSKQTSGNRESLTSIITTDDNETRLEKRSPHCNDNEVSPNVAHSKPDQLVNLQISSPINKTSIDSATVIDKQPALAQDKIIIVIDSSDSTEQEDENLLKQETEPTSQFSNIVLETNNSASNDSNDIIIQDNQLTDVETFKKSTMDISFEKTDSKGVLSEKVKPNLKRKSTDNLEGEKENLQMERTRKDQKNINIVDDVSDVDTGINLFQDIPADKWKEKDDVKTGSVQSTSQLVEEVEKENEAEHDLILVDKQAWLAAETIKAAKEAESFEYDSDDTVLLKSRLDSLASQANYDIEQLDEELTLDIDSNEKNEKQVKKRKSRTKKRLVSEIDEDIFRYAEDENNLIPVDKSLNESKTVLNRTNDRSISRLNKSEQSEKTKRRSSKASNELEKEIGDDANELNRSSLISKNNISLRKSTGERTSLNKSSKDISMQNISPNKSQTDNSEKELDDTAASTRKKLYKKNRSLERSCNEDIDDNATESEKKNVATEDCNKKHENTSLNHSTDQESEPIDTKKIIHLNESDGNSDIDVSVVAMDLGSKTSMIANMGSDNDECEIPRYLFTKANSESNTDDSNGYSDSLNREYNLGGLELKFSDDDVAADECRDSEVEFSDSDDNGSDLEDFIVDDIEAENDDEEDNDSEIENEEEENEEDNDIETENDEENDEEDNDIETENDEENDEEDNEIEIENGGEEDSDTGAENKKEDNDIEAENDDKEDDDNAVQKEKAEDEKEKMNFNTELINIENENEDNEDIQKKDIADKDTNQNKFIEMKAVSLYANTSHKLPKTHENNNKSIEHTSPCRSETETKQDIKMKKSNLKKNDKPILQNSSNSDLSIKKKKRKKSLVKENEIMSLGICNIISSSLKNMLDPQRPKDKAEQYLSEKLNELKSHALMKFNSLNQNSYNKLELDEAFERIPENIANKSNDMIKTTQNISVKDKSKKDLTLNKDSSKKIKDASKKKISSDLSLLSDLLKKVEGLTNPLKSPKRASRKSMNIDIETPRLKYLRKEKLNESAPTKLEYSTETNSLQKKLSAKKDATQIKIKEKDKDKIHDLIIPSNDDVIQKCSRKKQKKRKRQNSSNKNMTDEVLSEDVTELNVPKKKKIKLTPLITVEDNIHKDTCETNKKKKKKDKLKENITDKAKNTVELNVSKKKKPVKLTQLSTVEDNTLEDVSLSHSDERKLKQSILMRYIVREVWSKDITKLKKPEKKKHDKLTQLPIVEDNIREDIFQINEKKKKKKKQDTSKENIIDKTLSTDVIEIKIPKKKKCAKLSQLSVVEDAREEACQINKKKKKQINIVEENTNINKDNMLRNIRGNKTELSQHKKKSKASNNLELDLRTDKQEQQVKKKIKWQEAVESIEIEKKKKKKKEGEDTFPIQIPVSKKSEKILSSKLRLQETALGMIKSKNVARNTKELDETDAKVYTEEPRSKKKRNRSKDVENAICNIPTKSKKEVKERKFLLPSNDLKRLPDDVIENLANVPTKAKKRQKTSRDEKKIVSSTTTGKVKVTTTDHDNILDTSDCTTQFRVVNLQKTKKQSLKGAAAAVSFRERMLTRNNREPMSSYLMFCEKMSHPK